MNSKQKEWIKNIAKLGYAAKGIVYFITGALTAAYALNMGGKKSSSTESLQFINTLTGGKFLLGVIGTGLLCYSVWRIIMAVRDTEEEGTSAKGTGKRIAFAFSGLLYGSLAFASFKYISGTGSSSNGSNEKAITSKLLDLPFGKWLVILVGLITIGNGIYQIIKGVSGKYMKDISGLEADKRNALRKAGKVGFISRGIVFSIIGFLFVKAGWLHSASTAEGTSGAFSFLQTWPYGSWLLAAVAIGLMAYGFFMFVQAKYSNISIS
ncbi:DUF1206 domain-containing protein [Rufibacter roseus]|uniref:DUF1206 domain-containing protein n=1 Tax=Rufibacter roseus TaxID=1567108 RepID=A0ABW2DP28_9BACT|nr:DUF1206 domain-containing protein [Rufibacter roseus]